MSESSSPRPGVPDPQRDRHVAFPSDDAPSSAPESAGTGGPGAAPSSATTPEGRPAAPTARRLPRSAWAPAPGSGTPAPLQFPAPPPTSGRSRSSDPASKVVGAVVCGLIALALVANSGSAGSGQDPYELTGPDGIPVEVYDPAAGPDPAQGGGGTDDPRVSWQDEDSIDEIPVGQAVSAVPAGTTSLRFVVATVGRPTGLVSVVSNVGLDANAQTLLPGRGVVDLSDHPMYLRIDATTTDATASLQCQVWAGSTLVAVSSAPRTVTCEPDLSEL